MSIEIKALFAIVVLALVIFGIALLAAFLTEVLSTRPRHKQQGARSNGLLCSHSDVLIAIEDAEQRGYLRGRQECGEEYNAGVKWGAAEEREKIAKELDDLADGATPDVSPAYRHAHRFAAEVVRRGLKS